MASNPHFPVKCTNSTDLAVINLVFSVSGGVCCLISAIIVILLLLSKAYYTVLQRLFLLMLAIVLRGSSWQLLRSTTGSMILSCKIRFVCDLELDWDSCVVFTVGIKTYLYFYVRRVSKGGEPAQFLQSRH